MANTIDESNYTFVPGTIDGFVSNSKNNLDESIKQNETLIFLIEIINKSNPDKTENIRLCTIDPIHYASPYIYELTASISIEIFSNDFPIETVYLTKDISKKLFIDTITNFIEERKHKFS